MHDPDSVNEVDDTEGTLYLADASTSDFMDQKTVGKAVFPMELEDKQDLRPHGNRISYRKGDAGKEVRIE